MGKYKSQLAFEEFKNEYKEKFRAKKVPCTHNTPFVVYKSTKPLTECQKFQLETEKRSVSRNRSKSIRKDRISVTKQTKRKTMKMADTGASLNIDTSHTNAKYTKKLKGKKAPFKLIQKRGEIKFPPKNELEAVSISDLSHSEPVELEEVEVSQPELEAVSKEINPFEELREFLKTPQL